MSNNFNDKVGDYQPSNPDEVKQLYDDFAATYNDTLKVWQYEAPRVAAEMLRSYLPDGHVVLDAGCGTGLTGRALGAAGFQEISGIDISLESIELARATGAYTALQTADLSQPLPFEDNQFDGINCVGVLTYVPELQPVLMEFARVTKPNGIILFTQRQDLFIERDTPGSVSNLEAAGLIKTLYLSDAKPYLPGHEEFTDKIGVHYYVLSVHGAH